MTKDSDKSLIAWSNATMLNKIARFILFFSTMLFALVSCVSVKIGERKDQKSTSVVYETPSKPFIEIKSLHIDKSWQNSLNGSTISFLSECNNPVDPGLENILRGVITEIENTNIIESNKMTYNGREALQTILSGYVDGIETHFQLLIFKKNSCTYILTYAAEAKVFADNQRDFLTFVRGFKAL